MSKEIIVNVDTRETRVALIEAGKLVELHVEREERVVVPVAQGNERLHDRFAVRPRDCRAA